MKDDRPLAEQARDSILGLAVLAVRAPTIHRMSLQELEAYALLLKAGASDLNGAIHRLDRLIRQQKKSGAAGAVHDTRK
ncbi:MULTISPECIES: hypothetical protein [Luteibacter]|uniref:hypothetical protein n=1 Tax=Luteibacter TaxID=242605 RepID=UPI000567E480|nr:MULTISPECIES: hypothetical protein [unclassified Luteibacter]